MFILSLISIVAITALLLTLNVHPILAVGGGIVATMIWWWFAYMKLYGPK